MKKKVILIFTAILILTAGIFISYKYEEGNLFISKVLNKSSTEAKAIDKEELKLSYNEDKIDLNPSSEAILHQEEIISDPEIDLETAFKHQFILDTHNDTMMKVLDDYTWLPKVDLGENTSFDIDIPKLQSGGLKLPFFAAYTEGYYGNTERSISRTLALINALYYTERNNLDTFKIAKNLNDIVDIINEEKIAAVATIEGAYSLDDDHSHELLNQYNDLGIKAIGLNWNYSNKLGEGAKKIYGDANKTPSSGGLTELGEKVIKEMNRLGIIVDVSHMAESTFWDVIKVSTSPVIASHSGVDAIKSHQRNLNDKQLKALADNGGVISIVFYPTFLKNGDVYIRDMVDHIDYVVNLIGIDHVGLGSDFDGARMPKDLKDSSEVYKIRDELKKRNYNESDIDKILSGNILRVLREVEFKADKNYEFLDIEIIPKYSMGENVNSATPILMANLKGEVGDIKSSIIIDGIRYKAIFDKVNSNISYEIKDPIKEKFHVVTFEVESNNRIKRETRIFYK